LLPVPVNLWQVQNLFFDLLQRERSRGVWNDQFAALGTALSVRVEAP
jgi:hypothetical protein